MPTLTAVVPATDRPPTLARCLLALRASREGPEQTIVVRNPAGSGPAAARHAGAAQAVGDILVFVDADARCTRMRFAGSVRGSRLIPS